MSQRVAIFGSGVAGMSAAHELIKRGFDVDVYEASDRFGGKARSLSVPGSGIGSRLDLPGEHGFRFFPGFYKHLPDTMKEIEVGLVSAFDHLRDTTATLLARNGGAQSITTPNKFPSSLGDLIQAFKSFTLFYCDLGIPKSEVAHFIRCLLTMLVSCEDRRFQEFEKTSWFDFIGAAGMSQKYKDYLAKGLSRSLVALNADDLSARTGACILLQFLIDFTGFTPLDRVLDLPTNDAWITPWRTQLIADGVEFHLNTRLDSFQISDDCISSARIISARVCTSGTVQDITVDHYIAAIPVEIMQTMLSTDLLAADPSLTSIKDLKTAWMTGIIFYLNRDIPIIRGHANYLDSAWALTSISQPQFWNAIDLSDYGDGNVRGILSVIISNWEAPLFVGFPPANECSETDLKDFVWTQLKNHLPVLNDADLERVFLAPCLTCISTATPHGENNDWENNEQLFINKVDSWSKRPEAVTAIENLYLASDYVRTHTDLATMESANEAARRAVNGILDHIESPKLRCEIWPMQEPVLLAGYRVMDQFLYSLGLPPLVPPLPALPWPCPP